MILGNNGTGKTTLLQAFNWCLYDNNFKLEDPEKILNSEIAKNLESRENADVQVAIEFKHLEREYLCYKTQRFTKGSNGIIIAGKPEQVISVTDDITGETYVVSPSLIKEIFPKDLSMYFLFDGERMQHLAENNRIGKKDLTLAVTNLLGLEVLKNTIKHLRNLISEYRKDLGSDNTGMTSKLQKEINYLEQIISKNEDLLEEAKERKNGIIEKKDEIDNIFRNFAPLTILQKDREYKEKLIKIKEDDNKKIKRNYFKKFGNIAPTLLLNSVYDKILVKLANTNLEEKAIIGINSEAIKEIINRGVCICNREVKENSIEYNSLLDLKRYLPPENFSVLIKSLMENIERYKNENNNFLQETTITHLEYHKNIKDIEDLKSEVNGLTEEINKFGNVDMIKLNNERQKVTKEYDAILGEIGGIEQGLRTDKGQLDIRNKALDKLAATNKNNNSVIFRMELCQNMIDKLENRYKTKEKIIREDLQSKASKLLGDIMHSNKKILIEDDYNFSVSDEFGTEVLSEGEKIVTSFAFVGALITVAKETFEKSIQNEKTDENETNDNNFTLVMDAPFAKLDIEHRKKVIQYIPNLTDQIILFTADSQWSEDQTSMISKRIGKRYYLAGEVSGITNIKEVSDDI